MSCAFQPFHTPGPTALMSAVVRMVSSFMRSTDCTTAAKFSIVIRSERSRDCATVDITRWISISQATVSVSAAREAEPRAEAARDPRAGDRVVLDAALGDVVQEQRDVEQHAVLRLDRAHQVGGERRVGAAAGLDVGEDADAAQQMLVHRVVVVHVELHHRDDAAEGGHELAEHAGLVHPAQHGLGVVLRGEDLEEQAVGLLVLAQLGVDQLERAGGDVHRVGVKRQIVFLRQVEDADQVDRIALEHLRRRRR